MVPNERSQEQSLKRLDDHVAHRISHSYVVASLCDVAKELLENAVDAKATSIEICVENYGADLLQVVDNGQGISKENFQLLCQPHCTSKLSTFDDLSTVCTYGFRGEALCAICLMSNVTVFTRSRFEEVGHMLVYDHCGNLVNSNPRAREIGTTVMCRNCMEPFPVRRKELLRNLKKEFSRLVAMVQSYALILSEMNINFYHMKDGKKLKILSVVSCSEMRENVREVFGLPFLQELVPLVQHFPSDDLLEEFGLVPSQTSQLECLRISGYISSAQHGRVSKDRQYLFVNKRPCELKKISNLVNEVYKQYNHVNYPAFFLHLSLPTEYCDVNCSADKRIIILSNEALILATLKQSLASMFVERVAVMSCSQRDSERTMSGMQKDHSDANVTASPKGTTLDICTPKSAPVGSGDRLRNDIPGSSKLLSMFGFRTVSAAASEQSGSTEKRVSKSVSPGRTMTSTNIQRGLKRKAPVSQGSPVKSDPDKADQAGLEKRRKFHDRPITDMQSFGREQSISRVIYRLDVSWEEVKRKMFNNNIASWPLMEVVPVGAQQSGQFEEAAEQARQLLNRSDFANMEVIGQFNLGFIITRLDRNLFIIDQHASDEEYNYENLQKTAVVESQRLVVPITVEVSAYQRDVIEKNIATFAKSGFGIDLDSADGSTVRVTAVPSCYSNVFDKEDFDDLLAKCSTSPGIVHRTQKLNHLLASKACRKSIMVGTALRMDEMKRILTNLSTLAAPWNCPHGRPTVQHLVHLKCSTEI